MQMDAQYGASFYTWLKNEENVLVTAVYLQRIANEYPLDRVVNGLQWLIVGWKVESVVTLLRHLTLHWGTDTPSALCPNPQQWEVSRANLVQRLTQHWPLTAQAKFIKQFMAYWKCSHQKRTFLGHLLQEASFVQCSQLFSLLGHTVDYPIKVSILQTAAKKQSSRSQKSKRPRTPIESSSPASPGKTRRLSSSPPPRRTASNASPIPEDAVHTPQTQSQSTAASPQPEQQLAQSPAPNHPWDQMLETELELETATCPRPAVFAPTSSSNDHDPQGDSTSAKRRPSLL
jgi:hypothetical protein